MTELKQIVCHVSKCIIFAVCIIILFQACNHKSIDNNTKSKKTESTKINEVDINGLKNGEWVSYFQNGKIQSICHFKDGIPHGPIIVYNEKGDELYRGNFDNGSKIGEWVFTDPATSKVIKKEF